MFRILFKWGLVTFILALSTGLSAWGSLLVAFLILFLLRFTDGALSAFYLNRRIRHG